MLNFLQKDVDISHLSNFKTKAISKYYFEIAFESDIPKLTDIYDFASKNKLKVVIVWAWTNILFAFDYFEWIIIKNSLSWFNYDINTKILQTYSSEPVRNIAETLEKEFWQDLWHRFIWLPWSIWWGLYWNAWCFWLEMENNFLDTTVYNISTKKIEVLTKKDMNFSYRSSILKQSKNYFIISVRFDLSKKIEKYSSSVDNIKFREEIQPKWNSCGSFFKNPSKEKSAWFLIEQVWLKWYTYWCAYFSDKHANFLMTSKDNWDYKDLLYLIKKAQKEVKNKFWINLINEVNIITN